MTTHSAAAEQKAILAETDLPERKSVVDDFAGYRALRRRVDDMEGAGLNNPFFQPRDGVSHSVIRRNEKTLVSFSGYNYLGLNGHPAVTAAAKNAIDKFGTSASASRIVAGQIELHGELERKLADFLGTEDALIFISGYLTNVSVISHLLARPDAVVYNSGAHNSIITGARLSGAKTFTYPNGDWDGLDALLEKERAGFRRGLIVAEGVYSMDGQILDLKRAVETKKRHDMLLMVDEAHSFGIVGPDRSRRVRGGRPAGRQHRRLHGHAEQDPGLQRRLYRRRSRPDRIYALSLPRPDLQRRAFARRHRRRDGGAGHPGARAAPARRLRERAKFFRQVARENGLEICGDEESPVASLIVGDDKLAMILSHNLLEHGIEVQPIVRPAVSATTARLRFFLTANHTEEQILATVPVVAQELEKLRREVG